MGSPAFRTLMAASHVLRLEIHDNGVNASNSWKPGVGLTSIWERAVIRSSPRCRAGARGYVLKGAAPDNVIRAIAAVAAGEAIFGPGIARRALTYLSRPRPDQPARRLNNPRTGFWFQRCI